MAEPLSGNIATSDPSQAAQTYNLTTELVDLLARYMPYLKATGGASLAQLKNLRGGTVSISQSSGAVTITVTPAAPVPNPNPYG